MTSNRIAVLYAEEENHNSKQTSASTTRTACAHFRRRRTMWIMTVSLLTVVLVAGVAVSVVVRTKKNTNTSTIQVMITTTGTETVTTTTTETTMTATATTTTKGRSQRRGTRKCFQTGSVCASPWRASSDSITVEGSSFPSSDAAISSHKDRLLHAKKKLCSAFRSFATVTKSSEMRVVAEHEANKNIKDQPDACIPSLRNLFANFSVHVGSAAPIVFGSRYIKVYGVHETRAGKNSYASKPVISSSFGHYVATNPPADACDGDIATKHVSYGRCFLGGSHCVCGLDSGFYLELQEGAVLVTGLQICTADANPGRDPLQVTLEGSNAPVLDLTKGASWDLLYTGDSGLEKVLDRHMCGPVQWFNNSIEYKSYRFLVFEKRATKHCLQYAEVKLSGP